MKHLLLTVLSQRMVAEGFLEMTMSWPEDTEAPRPGQFFTARIGSGPSPLLRRPFAFSGYRPADRSGNGAAVRCIYQKRGPATTAMSGMEPGDSLDILAPLGTVFPSPEAASEVAGEAAGDATSATGDAAGDAGRGRSEQHPARPVLIAGGVGIGPMLYLAESLRDSNPLLVMGARSQEYLPLAVLPEDIETLLCTDDGSRGVQGTTIDALQQRPPEQFGTVYACGPNPMLAAAHYWAAEKGLPCFVSMEQTMGCAVGACMGCVVPVHGPQPYARVCMEGPVFSSDIIDWEGVAHG